MGIQGGVYTPKIWAQKSKRYLERILGDKYENDYIIWDLAAGTGNLLVGFVNPSNVYASTLDKNDVEIMKAMASKGKLALLLENIFQFDFLQDPLSKLPQSLQAILKDSKQRSKLIIYINPPYAEAGSKTQISKTGTNKAKVALSKTANDYAKELGKAKNELFAQFFMRIIQEIAPLEAKPQSKEVSLAGEKPPVFLSRARLWAPTEPQGKFGDSIKSLKPSQGRIGTPSLEPIGPILASFSKLKYLNSNNFDNSSCFV